MPTTLYRPRGGPSSTDRLHSVALLAACCGWALLGPIRAPIAAGEPNDVPHDRCLDLRLEPDDGAVVVDELHPCSGVYRFQSRTSGLRGAHANTSPGGSATRRPWHRLACSCVASFRQSRARAPCRLCRTLLPRWYRTASPAPPTAHRLGVALAAARPSAGSGSVCPRRPQCGPPVTGRPHRASGSASARFLALLSSYASTTCASFSRMSVRLRRVSISRHRWSIATSSGLGGLPAPSFHPRLERQEARHPVGEARAELQLPPVHGKVRDAPPELEQLLAWVAILLILQDRVVHRLLDQVVLQLEGEHRQPVDEQSDVQPPLRLVPAAAKLPRDREARFCSNRSFACGLQAKARRRTDPSAALRAWSRCGARR